VGLRCEKSYQFVFRLSFARIIKKSLLGWYIYVLKYEVVPFCKFRHVQHYLHIFLCFNFFETFKCHFRFFLKGTTNEARAPWSPGAICPCSKRETTNGAPWSPGAICPCHFYEVLACATAKRYQPVYGRAPMARQHRHLVC
jgi:hypothetical protein